ncbi:MAG: DUF4157 domain-containing protein [Nannocystaceae bacterium]
MWTREKLRAIEEEHTSRGSRHTPASSSPERGLGDQALLRLLPPTRPPIQADGAWRGRGRDDDRFEREAHSASARIAGGGSLDPRALTSTAGADAGLAGVHPRIEASIDGARGSGRRLPPRLRRSLGASLGADFRDVRIHTDDRAHDLSERLNARAFTTGRDVFFRRGAFDPHSRGGRDVLHHELTHVVQQCGRRPGGELGRASAPSIQRFVMQVGKDDDYTTTMSGELKKKHPGESFLQFNAAWDTNWIGSRFGEYAPVTTFRRKAIKKLKDVPNGETLRIVAHGNIRGQVGGYTASSMYALLVRLGLPVTHTGGVDIHACLPAAPYTEAGSTEVKQPHIVQLQDLLTRNGRTETVRGYVHTIFPHSQFSDIEVSSAAYGLFTEVYKPLFAARFERGPYPLSTKQIQTVRQVLGTDAAGWISAQMVGDSVKRPYDAYMALRDWMRANNHYFDEPRLRRAESVRLP